MILVSDGAVVVHGYQKHSAAIDFWIDTRKDNMNKLIQVFKNMDYEVDIFPETILNKKATDFFKVFST